MRKYGNLGSRERVVGIPGWLMESLLAIKPEPAVGLIFVSTRTGKAIANVRPAMFRARAAAGIVKKIHPHLLRHTCATHHLRLNTNLRKIQELLGHADLEMTRWYTQVGNDDMTQTANALNTAFTAAVENRGAPPVDPMQKPITGGDS